MQTREQIQRAVDDVPVADVEAAVVGSFAGLGNAAVVSKLLAEPDVGALFAGAPPDVFGGAAAAQADGGDLVFDSDEDAADYLNAIEGDGPGVTGMWLGQVAHVAWEQQGFAPSAPGTPYWLDRTIGTICKDVDAEGTPSSASLRPDGASLLSDGRVLDAELKPARIQHTAVPQLADRAASFAAAGVGVAHQHGPWSEGQIGPQAAAFGMTMLYEPGIEPGVVAYRWTRKAPKRAPEHQPVPVSERIVEAAREGYRAFSEWWADVGREQPWVIVPLALAFIAAGVTLALLLAPLLLAVLPFLAL